MSEWLRLETGRLSREQVQALLRAGLEEEHWRYRTQFGLYGLALLGGALLAELQWPLVLTARIAVLTRAVWCILLAFTVASRVMAHRARRRLLSHAGPGRSEG